MEGTITSNQHEVANIFANYFNTAAVDNGGEHVKNLKESEQHNHSSMRAIRDAHDGSRFEFEKFTKDEVNLMVRKLNPRKSCGWNLESQPKLLKHVAT